MSYERATDIIIVVLDCTMQILKVIKRLRSLTNNNKKKGSGDSYVYDN